MVEGVDESEMERILSPTGSFKKDDRIKFAFSPPGKAQKRSSAVLAQDSSKPLKIPAVEKVVQVRFMSIIFVLYLLCPVADLFILMRSSLAL